MNKNLNLIYGENAIGKSYATYLIYSLIKNVKNKLVPDRHFFLYGSYTPEDFKKKVRKELKQLVENNCIDFTKRIEDYLEEELKALLLSGIESSLTNTFSSITNLKNGFTEKHFEINIELPRNTTLRFFVNDQGLLDFRLLWKNDTFNIILKETKSTKFTLQRNKRKVFGTETENDFTIELYKLFQSYLNTILRSLDFKIRDVYYLPASRSGLYQALNSFTPIVAELTQNRFFLQNKSIELPSLSEPLSDYFIDLSTVSKDHINSEFSDLIEFLERDILKGRVEYDEKNKRIQYLPDRIKLKLNLSEASSMVSELSPLVLFFKHIINNKYQSEKDKSPYYFDQFYSQSRKGGQKDIIFIEEPEAHLHPAVQVKLMQVFAELAARNIKVFITSHSNYMFNKINNIILQDKILVEDIAVYHLVRDSNGGTIDGDMSPDKDGINDDNFQDVAKDLYNERMNLL